MDNEAYDNETFTENVSQTTPANAIPLQQTRAAASRKVSFAEQRQGAITPLSDSIYGSERMRGATCDVPATQLSQTYHEPRSPFFGIRKKALSFAESGELGSSSITPIEEKRYTSFSGLYEENNSISEFETESSTLPSRAQTPNSLSQFVDDSTPLALFVELLELRNIGSESATDDGFVFRQTARWIKLEEDVELQAGRWSKPHVASLSFHSLTNLRRCLDHAVLVLEYDSTNNPDSVSGDFGQLIRDLVEKCRAPFSMNALQMLQLKKCLLHRRQHFIENTYVDSNTSSNSIGRKFSSVSQMLSGGKRSTFGQSPAVAEKKLSTVFRERQMSVATLRQQSVSTQLGKLGRMPSTMTFDAGAKVDGNFVGLQRSRSRAGDSATSASYLAADYSNVVVNTDYLKYLPSSHAEAAVVLAGSHESLTQVVTAFVRLEEAQHMPGLVEVPVPVRFVLILLGPSQGALMCYHQVARCWATLMANSQFQTAAYMFRDKNDILAAMNEFLDFSVVLPPDRLDTHLQALARDSAWNFQQTRWRRNVFEKQISRCVSRCESVMESQKNETVSSFKSNANSFPIIISDRKTSAASETIKPSRKISPVDDLLRGSRLFNGLLNDIFRRYPWYLRDWLDGFNFTCLTSTFFMFFAVLTISTSLGALMSAKTGGLIGIEEVLASTSMCGVLFALFSCQPIVVLAMTGPFMVYEGALYGFCSGLDGVDYLSFRFWIALWVVFYVLILLYFDLIGCLVRFVFKRFVEDVWTALLALIYIYESISRMITMFIGNPVLNKSMYVDTWNETMTAYGPSKSTLTFSADKKAEDFPLAAVEASSIPYFLEPNTALTSLFLLLGTFSVAMVLKEFRNSHFFGKSARRCCSDFGVAISIFIFALIALLVPHVYIEKIALPKGMLQVTSPGLRGWFVHPLQSYKGVPLPVWSFFAAALPAILVLIIMFLLIEVGQLNVCKSERRLKRGSGYHFDLLLAALLYIPCALLGLPWMGCTVVASAAHVTSLSVFERIGKAPGDKPQFIEVKEQRVTALAVPILIGIVTLFGQKLLMLIPVSCLYGVFIYMGVNSLSHLDFTKRLFLFSIPRKHHPSLDYVTNVNQWRMHLFTAVQLVSVVALIVVAESRISLFLPIAVVLLVPIRYGFTLVYSKDELNALDADDRKAQGSEYLMEEAPLDNTNVINMSLKNDLVNR